MAATRVASVSANAVEKARGRRVPAAALSQQDLGELLSTFNEVTGRLQSAHERLTGEVARLQKELRGANRQLRRARELAALGEMAAGIAHEVRNPLGSIKLYAKVLVEDLGDRPNEKALAEKIAGAVDRLNAVVGDVLSFSREIRARRAGVNAWDVVSAAVDSARGVGGPGVMVEADEAALVGVAIVADAGLLSQAVTNVVRNACEAVGEASGTGRVTVTAERRRVLSASGERGDGCAIVVGDTGPGVPDEVLARVFNPFFTTRHTGTGLGLAIVHRIVDAHGGTVTIRNVEEGGVRTGAVVELIVPDPVAGEAEEPE